MEYVVGVVIFLEYCFMFLFSSGQSVLEYVVGVVIFLEYCFVFVF